jgi:hypothetical protein
MSMFRKYETLAKDMTAPSLQQLHHLALDWTALFEVWSISDSIYHILEHSIEIPLPAEEIKVQIYQSFWCGATSEAQTYNWKLQFPTSIGANTMTFSILRTIYRFHPAGKAASSRLQSIQLPLDADQTLSTLWSQYTPSNHQTLGTTPAFTFASPLEIGGDFYLYWITFSEDGKSLVFTDQRLRCPKTVASFEIGDCEKLEVSFIRSIVLTDYAGPGSETIKNLDIAFHPKEALIGFIFAESVYLWSYKQGKHLLVLRI